MSFIILATYCLAVAIFIFWSGKWVVHILAITYGKIKLHKKSRLKTTMALDHHHHHHHPLHQASNVIMTNGSDEEGMSKMHHHHHLNYHHYLNPLSSSIPLLHETEFHHKHHHHHNLTTSSSCSSNQGGGSGTNSTSSLKDNKEYFILNSSNSAPIKSGVVSSEVAGGTAVSASTASTATVAAIEPGPALACPDTIIDLSCDFCENAISLDLINNSSTTKILNGGDSGSGGASTDQLTAAAVASSLSLGTTPATAAGVAATNELGLALLDKEQKVLVNNSNEMITLPKVSILKPLLGPDPNLAANLETFFTMNYPKNAYELLFCVESKQDPAIGVCKTLMDKYKTTVDARLFIGGAKVGVNPKINNMEPGYQASKYELIMISDAGIKMKPDTLLDMVEHMTEKVGLVHQMPFTCDREGFAATYEKIFFGTVQSRIYLAADLLNINCHTGMSCLTRKKILEDLGGLRSFGCYLAEDFFLAKKVLESGMKMTISSHPALQNSGVCDLKSFQNRLMRWAKLRVAMVPTTILLEPLSECMIVGAFTSWSVSILFHWDSLVFYLIHILCWFLSDWILLSIVQNGSLPFSKFEFVVGWLFREFTGPYLFFSALWNPAIRWRARVYKLAWGGVAHELSSSKIKT